MLRAGAIALWLAIAATAAQAQNAPGPVGTPQGQWRDQTYWVPLTVNGQTTLLYTRVCRPAGEAPARVIVIAHGTPADTSKRASMAPVACSNEAAQWFLTRGFVVVASMRRSYGATGGPMADGFYQCDQGPRDYAHNGLTTAADIAATIDYAATLPFARPTGMVLVGQSAGGLGAIAFDSLPHPRVSAIINFAGGNGGHLHDQPSTNCQPERLAVAAGELGRSATTPMLWIYTANDSFFNPDIAGAMYAAFAKAGGKAEYDALPAFGSDGHDLLLLRGGSAVWGPLVEHYLAAMPTQ